MHAVRTDSTALAMAKMVASSAAKVGPPPIVNEPDSSLFVVLSLVVDVTPLYAASMEPMEANRSDNAGVCS